MPSIQLGPVEDEDFSSHHEEDPTEGVSSQPDPHRNDPESETRIGSDADANEKAATTTEPGNGSYQRDLESGDDPRADSASSPNVVPADDVVENATEGATPLDNANEDDDEAPVPGTEALHDTYWNEEERSTSNDGASQKSDGSDDSTSSSSSESDSSDDSESASDANVDTDTAGDDNPTDTDPESLQKSAGEPLSEDDVEPTSIADQDEPFHNENESDSELEDFDPAPVGAVVVPYDDEYESGIEGSKDDPTNLTRDGDASIGISGVTEVASIEEEADKRHWRRLFWLSLVLVGTVVIIAALVGGLVGALYYKRSSPAAATTTAPSKALTKAPSKAPTPSPSLRPTFLSLAPSTTSPTPVGTQTAAVTESPTSTVTAPTPTTSPSLNGTLEPTTPLPSVAPSGAPTSAATSGTPVNITNEALFLVIANLSADGGAAVLRAGTPQSQAFLSVQAEAGQLGGVQPQAVSDAQSQLVQRYALRTFFYSTNGPVDWINRTDWENSTVNECLWYSQPPLNDGTMCNADNVVKVLAFKANGVTGVLPPELSMLTGLARLSIEGVEGVPGLVGGIPSTLASLTGMTDLMMQYHKFTESVPAGLWNSWSGAYIVSIADCNVPGLFPDVSALTSVALLDFSGNRLRGVFPSGLSNFTSLVALNVANNKLKGTLTFDSMPPRIKLLNVSSNAFTGSIPSSVGKLTTLKQGLDLSHNQLTGSIPSEINNLVNLTKLSLSFNLLTGSVPELTNLTQLSVLALEGNNVTGVVSNATCNALASSGSTYSVTTDCNPDGSSVVLCPCCTACCLHVLNGECQWSPAT